MHKASNKRMWFAPKMSCLLVALSSFSVLLLLSSCYMDVGKSTSLTGSSTSKTSTTATTSVEIPCTNCTKVGKAFVKGMAGLMALNVFELLVLTGCDVGSAAIIALAFFDWMSPSLVASVDADKPLELASYMAGPAIAALSNPDFVLPEGKSKADIIKAIIGGYFQGLGKNSGYGLTSAEQQTLLGSFVGSAVGGIVDAGVSDKGEAVAAIASAMIGNLTAAGMVAADFAVLGHDLMADLVGHLKNAGLTDVADISDASAKAARAAVVAFGAVTPDKSQLSTLIDQLSQGAVVGLKALDLTDEQQSQVSAEVAKGATQGMSDAGYTSAEIEAHKTQLNNQIATGLQTNGVSTDEASKAKEAMQSAIDGIISGLGK